MYYYVEDREDLVFQCYRRAAEITARHLLEASRAGGTAADMLRSFVTRMLDPNEPEIAARAEIAMLNADSARHDPGFVRRTRDASRARAGDRRARRRVLRRCDVEVSARIILSLVTWALRAAVGACSRPDGSLAAARSSDRNCLRRLFQRGAVARVSAARSRRVVAARRERVRSRCGWPGEARGAAAGRVEAVQSRKASMRRRSTKSLRRSARPSARCIITSEQAGSGRGRATTARSASSS